MILLLNFCIDAFATTEPNIYTENKLGVMVTVDQPQFMIRLESNPTTGYSWYLRDYDRQFITPLKHYYEAPDNKLMGHAGHEVWVFSAKPGAFTVPQMTQIDLVYIRPWDVTAQSKQVIFRVVSNTR